MLRLLAASLLLLTLTLAPALAQDDDDDEDTGGETEELDPYLDDRSTAEGVILSFYNAINRYEYARAYSYFGRGREPDDFDSFETGYGDTFYVEIRFGEITDEGAAGSTYWHVPVKLNVETTERGFRYFAGCYVVRLANPSIQATPPYRPMHIDDASLRRSSRRAGPPDSCG